MSTVAHPWAAQINIHPSSILKFAHQIYHHHQNLLPPRVMWLFFPNENLPFCPKRDNPKSHQKLNQGAWDAPSLSNSIMFPHWFSIIHATNCKYDYKQHPYINIIGSEGGRKTETLLKQINIPKARSTAGECTVAPARAPHRKTQRGDSHRLNSWSSL